MASASVDRFGDADPPLAFSAAGGPSAARGVPVTDPEQGPGLTAAAAMAAAVRQELTSPGSVSAQQQLSLFLAERTAHQLADPYEHA